MTEWIKAGVCGDLTREAQKCKGRIIRLYKSKGEDFFLTAVRDGNHMGGTFHQIGEAFDFLDSPKVTEAEIRQEAGPGFDCVFHSSHNHMEHDPKF